MWWSHGVAAGEQMKLQCWPLSGLSSAGSGGGNTLRFYDLEAPIWKGLKLFWCAESQAAPRMVIRTQNLPAPLTWARFHHQCVEEVAAFQCSPQWAGSTPQKQPPTIQLALSGCFFELFRREAKAWTARKQNKLSHELPRPVPWSNAVGDSWHLKKPRFQILRLLQFSTFTSIQIHLR